MARKKAATKPKSRRKSKQGDQRGQAETPKPNQTPRADAQAERSERDLLRPTDTNLDVTAALSGVRPDQHLCAVCTSTVRGVALHHIQFRSRGGIDGPVIPICLTCHNNIHGVGNKSAVWRMEINTKGIYLYDRNGEEGDEPIWRQERWPLKTEPGVLVQALDQVSEITKQIVEFAPSLTPIQALEVQQSLKGVGLHAWRATAQLVYEMHRYRMPHLDKADKLTALCRFFDMRRSHVYDLLMIVEAFYGTSVLEESSLSKDMLRVAAGTDHPEDWAEHAETRKVEHPQYSASDLKTESKNDRRTRPAAPESKGPQRFYGKCGHCGQDSWMEKLPVGSNGEPPDIGKGS